MNRIFAALYIRRNKNAAAITFIAHYHYTCKSVIFPTPHHLKILRDLKDYTKEDVDVS